MFLFSRLNLLDEISISITPNTYMNFLGDGPTIRCWNHICYIAKTADSHLYNSRSHPPYAIGLLVLYTHSAFRFHIYIRSIEEVCVFPSKECWLCQGRLVVIWGPRQFARPWGVFSFSALWGFWMHHHATMWI